MTSSMTFFLNMALLESFRKTALVGGAVPGVTVTLFAVHECHAGTVSTAIVRELCAISATKLVRRFHSYDLPRNPGTNLVIIYSITIANSFKNLINPYTPTSNEVVPERFDEIFSSGLYTWDSQATLDLTVWSGFSEAQHSRAWTSGDQIVVKGDPRDGVESGRNRARLSQYQVIRAEISADDVDEIEEPAMFVESG